jgi:hypothetical protein
MTTPFAKPQSVPPKLKNAIALFETKTALEDRIEIDDY